MTAQTPRTRPRGGSSGRVVVALGGNAIAPAGTGGTAGEQARNIARAMVLLADLIVAGNDLVITHGNGPQVGDLLLKNELARDVVAPVPLDWCVAETQATIGYLMIVALERELAARGNLRTVVPVISRVKVSRDDPAWDHPTKPIGPYVQDENEVRRRGELQGQTWVRQGDRGWRRVVASPEPVMLLEPITITLLLDAGAVVVANGGGGIPMVEEPDGHLVGVEAVVDKDLAGSLLARQIGARSFVILTDVPGVAVEHGTPAERWLGDVTTPQLRRLQSAGHFAAGSMGPKVEAALRFVEATGHPAVIAALNDAADAFAGGAGTRVMPHGSEGGS